MWKVILAKCFFLTMATCKFVFICDLQAMEANHLDFSTNLKYQVWQKRQVSMYNTEPWLSLCLFLSDLNHSEYQILSHGILQYGFSKVLI